MGGNSVRIVFASLLKKGVILKRKKMLLALKGKIAHKLIPFQKGFSMRGKLTGSYKNCLPCRKNG